MIVMLGLMLTNRLPREPSSARKCLEPLVSSQASFHPSHSMRAPTSHAAMFQPGRRYCPEFHILANLHSTYLGTGLPGPRWSDQAQV